MRISVWRYGRLVVGRGASAAFQAITLIALARFSTIAEFGMYATGVAVGAICIGVFGMGLPTLVLRSEAREATGLAGSALLIAGCGALIAAVLVSGVLTLLIKGSPVTVVLAAAIFAASELWLNLVQNLLLGTREETAATLMIVLRRAVPLAATLIFISQGWDVYGGLTAGSMMIIVIGTGAVWHLRKRRRKLVHVWRETRHFWAANVASMFQQLDVVLIRQGLGNASAAAYSAAFRLASPIHIVTTAITSQLVPALAAETKPEARAGRQRKYMIAGISYAVVVLLVSPVTALMGPLLLGPQYVEWRWVFPLTFINSALSVINQMQAAVLYAYGSSRWVARMTVVSVLCGLLVVFCGAAAGSLLLAISGTILIQLILIVSLGMRLRMETR